MVESASEIDQGESRTYACRQTVCSTQILIEDDVHIVHPRRSVSALGEVERLFDVYTIGDEIYLVSSTSLIDGAEALACAPEFCGMRPATGQLSSAIPFPMSDVALSGWIYTSSPSLSTPLNGSQWYGLETIQLVVANRGGEDSDLLKEFWRGTALEWNYHIHGSTELARLLLPERVREVHIYDIDGTVVRFLGYKQANGAWEYRPAFGVFAELLGDENGFILRGGDPGNMRAKGGWEYRFDPLQDGAEHFPTSPYAPLRAIVSPLGIVYKITGSASQRVVYDPISKGQLIWDGGTLKYFHPGRLSQGFPIADYSRGSSITLPTLCPQLCGNSVPELGLPESAATEEVSYSHQSNQVVVGGGMYSPPGSPSVVETRNISYFSDGELRLLGRAFQTGTVPPTSVWGRLTTRGVGNLAPYQYTYRWVDTDRFRITTERDGLRTSLTYRIDEPSGKFVEAFYRRPSLSGAGDELLRYEFNLDNGQVQKVEFFPNTNASLPKWEVEYNFGLSHDPLAVTAVEQRFLGEGITRRWEYTYTESNRETLLASVQDPTGVVSQFRYEHSDYPVLPSAVVDAAGNRWEFRYTGSGLLQSVKAPGRGNSWQLDYYPEIENQRIHPYANKLRQITDPTRRAVLVTEYDLLGRPTRWEVPLSDRHLWQKIDWTTTGQPRRIEWSDRSRIDLYWQGLWLRAMRDARGRVVVFDYDLGLGYDTGSAGLLSQIRFLRVGEGPPHDYANPSTGQVFAQLYYDYRGRLTGVRGGNGIGVGYVYGHRDQLREVRYDGSPNAERFTYRCCGELESWTKPDGRSAFFDYEGGLLKYIRLGSANANPSYVFSYDLAGRLKGAQLHHPTNNAPITLHSWVYEYEVGRSTGRLAQENNYLAPLNLAYTHEYTYYPDGSVENATLQLPTLNLQRTLRYIYDDAGRLTDIFYNGQPLASYSYDGAGRLISQTIRPLNTNHTLTATVTYADAQSVGAVGTLEWRWNNQVVALFDYDGFNNQPGYYPDGTLARAVDTLQGSAPIYWEWDYDFTGQLAYERRRFGNGDWQQTDFTYDLGGNLWANQGWVYHFNKLIYVPQQPNENNAWYFTHTPNGERWRQWASSITGSLEGDVNGDGTVDDADLNAILFAFGNPCTGCPEDLNNDGTVDDGDMAIVLFNFGNSVGTVSWEYAYDIWGNLIEARSQAGTYRAGYDALGRRVWEEVQTEQGTRRTYFLYEGDTIIGEVGTDGAYEYVWGLLGPIARIDLNNPANTRYYVLDGLGHVRLLLNPAGAPTDLYHYDSWGNPIPTGTETTRQPFRWNGAYGYEYIPATGLYHVGAREYDPKTRRWLQRDPIDVAGGHPNVYLYCGNEPVNSADPSGLDWWEDFKRWYLGGMGGFSQWVDQNLMFGLTERFGTTAGLYDCGLASGWELTRDATLWSGGLLLAGMLTFVPADEVARGGAAMTSRTAATQGIRGAAGRGASIQRARQLGRAGEQKAGIRGPKKSITTSQGKRRIPDSVGKPPGTLIEVKNVKELRFTKQLHDYLNWCTQNNHTFILITRRNTVLDKRLQDLIRQGKIIHRPIL